MSQIGGEPCDQLQMLLGPAFVNLTPSNSTVTGSSLCAERSWLVPLVHDATPTATARGMMTLDDATPAAISWFRVAMRPPVSRTRRQKSQIGVEIAGQETAVGFGRAVR